MIGGVRAALALALLLAPPVRAQAASLESRLVPFSLPDLEGRLWTPANLLGKTALVNVWATWCAPCRDELPFVQKLHERLVAREEVIVLSISIDEKPQLAREFAKRHGLTFPVLLAPEFVETHFLATGLGIPVSWLVDPDGVVRRKPARFETDGEAWLAAILKQLEARPAPPAR